jgi:hypothetical protein
MRQEATYWVCGKAVADAATQTGTHPTIFDNSLFKNIDT